MPQFRILPTTFNDITHVIRPMQHKYRYMNSQNSIQYATGLDLTPAAIT